MQVKIQVNTNWLERLVRLKKVCHFHSPRLKDHDKGSQRGFILLKFYIQLMIYK